MRRLAYPLLAILLLIAAIAPWQTVAGAFTDWTRASGIDALLLRRPTIGNVQRLLWPDTFKTEYKGTAYYRRWWVNSFTIATTTAVFQSVISVLTGYALARYRFPGHGLLFAVLLLRYIIPANVLFIPLYMVVHKLGLTSMQAMVLPMLVNAGAIIMTRQFALGLAHEIFEAASIDGANDWQMLRYIAGPMLSPMVGMTFAGTFAGAWNSILWANMVLKGINVWTAPQGVLYMMTQARLTSGMTDYGLISAAALLSLLLPVVVFVVLQRHVEAGMEGLIRE